MLVEQQDVANHVYINNTEYTHNLNSINFTGILKQFNPTLDTMDWLWRNVAAHPLISVVTVTDCMLWTLEILIKNILIVIYTVDLKVNKFLNSMPSSTTHSSSRREIILLSLCCFLKFWWQVKFLQLRHRVITSQYNLLS